jgi:hypothetical protein
MLAALGPEAVREAQKLFFIDGVEYRHHRSLEKFVLQRGDTQRPLPPIRFE